MNKELKRAIVNYMFDNANEFQLVNSTVKNFSQYIYTPDGNFCFGGEEVSDFISSVYNLIKL